MKFIKRLLLLSSVLLLFACSRKTTKSPVSSTVKPTTQDSSKTTTENSNSKAKKMVSLSLSKNIDEAGSVEGSGSYEEKTRVKIKATANDSYEFKGWYKGEELISTLNEYEFNISENTEIVAKFDMVRFSVEVFKVLEQDGTILVDNEYIYGSTLTVTADEVYGYTFIGWHDLDNNIISTETSLEITVTSAITLFARYTANSYTVTLNKNVDICSVTGSDTYKYNSFATVKATASDGYKFVSWNNGDEIVSTDSEYTFKVLGNTTLTAIFEPLKYEVTFSSNMQDVATYTGAGEYDYGSSVTVNVTPKNSGYIFIGWYINSSPVSTDAIYTFTMPNSDVNLYARFNYNKFNVSATQNIDGAGTISGIGEYYYRTTVTVTTTLSDGYNFLGWFDLDDNELSKQLSYTFQLQNNDVELVAKYELATYTITVTKNIEEAGTITGETSYHYNDNVCLEEEENDGYTFIGWFNGENLISDTYECLFSMPCENLTIEARYDYESNYVRVSTNMEEAGSIPTMEAYKYLDTVTLTATVNTGYVFNGWYIGENKVCSELTYTFTMGKDLVDLTVKYSYLYLTVTINQNYDNAGKITGSNPRYIRYNTTTDLIITPNTGYTFIGWYIGSTQISDELTYTYTVLEDVTITAKFDIEEYTLAIQKNMDGGTVTGAGTYEYNSEVTVTVTLNPGYYFLKMKNEVTGDVITELTYTFTFTGETVITVTFEKIVYFAEAYVESTSEGRGTVSGTIDEAYYNDEATFIATPTNEGYTFIGWYDNEDNLVSEEATYTFNVTENVRLYAKFSINTYTLTLTMNIEGAATLSGAGTYEYSPTFVNASAIAQTKHGYVFIGWFENNELVSEDDAYYFKMPYRNVNLEARFEKDTYTVAINTYIIAGGTVTGAGTYEYNSEVTVSANVETYYKFEGWYRGLSAFEELITTDPNYTFTITENTYISAKWTLIRYHLTTINSDEDCGYIYELTNYDCAANHEVEVLDASPKTGYEFVGWYEGDELFSTIPNYKFYPTKDLTLTAKWRLIDYNIVITVSNHDEIVTITAPSTANLGDTITLSIELNDDAYSFMGWHINDYNAIGYTTTLEYEIDIYTVNKVDENNNLNITARVIKKYNTLTLVNSNTNAGTIVMGESGSYQYGQTIQIAVSNIQPGYTFKGWYNGDTLVNNGASYAFSMPDADITYTAKYDLVEYTITYNLDGGLNDSENIETYTIETNFTLKDAIKSGYEFVGWYTEDDNKIDVLANGLKTDIELFARYSLLTYTITYELNDGINNDNNLTSYTVEDPVTFYDPTKFAHDFMYWYILDGTDEVEVTNTLGLVGNITVYAKFNELESLKYFNYSISGTDVIINSVKDEYLDITELVIPNVVTKVSKGALKNCSSLVKLTTPFIGEKRINPTDNFQYTLGYMFGDIEFEGSMEVIQYTTETYGEDSIPLTYYVSSSLEEVYVTDSTYIPDGAFVVCTNLKKVVLPNTVTACGFTTFYGDTGLTDLVLGDNITEFAWGTLIDCSGLINLSFGPTTLVALAYSSENITDCTNLENIYFNGSLADWINSANFNFASTSFMNIASNIYFLDEDGEIEYNGLKYSAITGELVIPDGVVGIGVADLYNIGKNITSIIIPNSVIGIAPGALAYFPMLESITLPFTGNTRVTTTSDYQYPFCYVFGTKAVEGYTSVEQTYIDVYYSTNPTYKTVTYYIPSTLKNVTLTDSTYILYGAFYNCSNLENITLDCTVENIAANAFYGCESIEEMIIPDGVLLVNNYAFNYCTSLKSIVIPNSCLMIGEGILSNCNSIESIQIPFIGQKRYSSSDVYQYPLAYLFKGNESGDYTLEQMYQYVSGITDTITISMTDTLQEVIITDCTYIQRGALENLKSVRSIILPDTLTSINEGALAGCSNLSFLSIPFIGDAKRNETTFVEPFTYIFGNIVFENSTLAQEFGIESYFIPNSLEIVLITNTEYIPSYAFRDITTIDYIIMPNSLTKIGRDAFKNCTAIISWDNTEIATIDSYAFSGYKGYSLTIPMSVESIKPYAFNGCEAIVEFDSETSLTKIEANAFNGYLGTSFIIPESIIEIEEAAFSDCTNLAEIEIGSNVRTIGNDAFNENTSLLDVYYNGSLNNWIVDITFENEDSSPMNYASNFYILDENGSIEHNGKYYSNPKEVTLSGDITYINSDAFRGFKFLENVYFDGTVENWLNIDFKNIFANPMYYAEEFYILDENGSIEHDSKHYSIVTEITIPSTLKVINYQLIGFKYVEELVIPGTVEKIELGALNGFSSLKYITIPFVGTELGSDLPFAYIFGSRKYDNSIKTLSMVSSGKVYFYVPAGLEEITLTNGSIIYEYGFAYLKTIKKVTIFEDITEIQYAAFYECVELEEVVLPQNLREIGMYAFAECYKLRNLVIPGRVESITNQSFYNCRSLLEIWNYSLINMQPGSSAHGYVSYYAAVVHTSAAEESILVYDDNGLIYLDEEKTILVKYVGLETSITIPNTVVKIHDRAFFACNTLENIIMPDSVESIGSHVFDKCSSLNYNVYDNAYYLGNIDNPYLVLVKAISYDITGCNINEDCKIINYRAFYDCRKLTSIVIPNGIQFIGTSAFGQCYALVSMTIPFIGDKRNEPEYTNLGYIFATSDSKTGNDIFNDSYSKLTEVIITDTETIYSNAFSSCSQIVRIVLPDSLRTIGTNAFSKCDNLASIIIPSQVESIESNAFNSCRKLHMVYNLSNLDIVKGETNNGSVALNAYEVFNSIDDYENTFLITEEGYIFAYANSKLYLTGYKGYQKTITLPSVVTINGTDYNSYEIADYAFENIHQTMSLQIAFTSITIPNSVTKIGKKAFYNNKKLEYVTLPESLVEIGEEAFMYCFLRTITVPGSIGVIKKRAFAFNTFAKTIIIGEGVTQIEEEAFSNCNGSTKVTLPSTIESIDVDAFMNCSLNYNIKDNGKYLGNDTTPYLFLYSPTSTEINSFTVNSQCKIIREKAFINCYDIIVIYNYSSLNITKGSTENGYIGYYAYYILTSSGDPIPDLPTYSYNGFKFMYQGANILLTEFVEEEYSGNVENVNLPESVTIEVDGRNVRVYGYKIARKAFKDHTSMKNLFFPSDKVLEIGSDAFDGCTGLENVYCTSDSYYYEEKMDDWCTIKFVNAKSNPMYYAKNFYITGPDSELYYYDEYFSLLTEFNITTSITEINNFAFYNFTQLTKVTLERAHRTIGNYAFYNCTNLSYFDFEAIKHIGNYAFYNCTSLETVTLDYGLEHIGNYAFYNCESFTWETWIPETVKYIGDYAFYNCKMTGELAIIGDVYKIGKYAFYYNNIEKLTIIGDVRIIGEAAFKYCFNLKTVIIEAQVEKIEDSAFFLSNLSSIDFGTSLVTIEKKAFYQCDKLTSLVFPDSLETIGEAAFYQGSGNKCELTEIKFGKSLKKVGKDAFAFCYKLKNVELETSEAYFDTHAFAYCDGIDGVYFNGTIADWYNFTFGDADANPVHNTKYFYYLDGDGEIEFDDNHYSLLTDLIIEDGITEIKPYLFVGMPCVNLTLPSSLELVDSYALAYQKNLTNVYYKGNMTTYLNIWFKYRNPMIEGKYFYMLDPNGNVEYDGNRYSLLEEIIIPDGTIKIGSHQFAGFNGITNITIPASVKQMDVGAFNLSRTDSFNVYFNGTLLDWVSITFEYSQYNPVSEYNKNFTENFHILDENGDVEYNGNRYTLLKDLVIDNSIVRIKNYQLSKFMFNTITIENTYLIIQYNAFDKQPDDTVVYYYGTEHQWEVYLKKYAYHLGKNIYYYSETRPTTAGNYWHYVDDVPTIWE